jgi:uncharacterized membrane protein
MEYLSLLDWFVIGFIPGLLVALFLGALHE